VRRMMASREKLLDEVERTLAAVEAVPAADLKALDVTASRIADIRRLVAENGPLFDDLLAAPPIERSRSNPADPVRLAAAEEALKRLQRGETRIQNRIQSLQSSQRNRVEETALRLEQGSGKMRMLTIWWGASALTLGLLIMVWATINLRPLRRLRDAAQKIAAGDYGDSINERGPREVADLAREFNTMGKRIQERERELVRTERLAAVGKMAAVVTHEVRNPLSSIGLHTELLDEELAGLPEAQTAEARALCRSIQSEVDRLTGITEEYLHFARLPRPKLSPEALNPIISSLTEFEREAMARNHIELVVELDPELPPVLVDEGQLRQALRNLLRNASDALSARDGGQVVVTTRRGDGDMVEVAVADDGPGIAAEVQGRLFDAFVSTKDTGTGLGLALTHEIIREHGGAMRVESPPGHGATFIVALPSARAAAI
jgi:two-component system NtrC family sensor kinase